MGRNLFRTLIANGFVRLPDKAPPEPAPRRRMLLERLEDRLLFDAGPVAPVDADAELTQQAAAVQEAMPLENSIAEPAEVRVIDTLDDVQEMIADLIGQPLDSGSELALNPNETPDDIDLLNSDELTRQLLTTSDEQHSELDAATDSAVVTRREVAFVDTSVAGYEQLVEGILDHGDQYRQIEVVLIDAGEDGLARIAQTMRSLDDIDAIHLVSHGGSGQLRLGRTMLNLDSMSGAYAEQLVEIGQHLGTDADILVYGCDFAAGDAGKEAVDFLSRITGADVSASDDATGNVLLGGDWQLEQSIGTIESLVAVNAVTQMEWQSLLAILDWDSVNWTNEALSGSFSVGGGTISLTITGDTDDFEPDSPNDDTTNTGGLSPTEESLLLSVDYESQTTLGDEATTTMIDFTHSGGVSDVSFTIFDIDLSSWTDQIIVTANNGSTINPSSVTNGSANTFDGVNMVTGTVSSGSSSANGNATFTFDQAGITQVSIVYRSGRLSDPTLQFISLHDITFNVAPVLDLDASGAGTGYSTTFTEDGSGVAIADSDSSVTDTDSANMSQAVITLTNPQTSDVLSVSGSLPAGISLDAASTSTNLILTGSATKASYETAIEQIRFNNSSQNPNTTARSVTVVVTDDLGATSNTATTTITVNAVNDAPTGGNRTVTTAEDTDFTFTTADFPFSDVDGDSLTRVRIDTLPTDGTVLLSGVAVSAGQIVAVANITAGNLTFRPDSNENGSPYTTFTFSVGEASAFVASPSTMTVNVTPVNDAPTGGNRTVTTAEDTDFAFTTADFPFSDVDGGSLSRVRIDTLPADGTVLLSGVAVTAGQIVTVANITAGNLKFRPDTNENGSPYTTFTFSVGDASTFVASPSTMTVNVTPVNDAPTGGNRTVTTAEDTDFTFTTADFPFSDVDGDPLSRVRIDTLPADGTVLLSGVAVTAGQIVTVANITAGNLRFRPDSNENGSPYTTFTFSVGETSAFVASPSTMTVNVTPVNDAPTGGNRTVTTAEDTDFTFTTADFPFSDVDGDSLSRVRIDTLPADGTVLLSGIAVTAGQVITVANITAGNLRFRPDTNENGSPYTTFTFSVGDASTFVASPSTMTVNVTPVNDAPTGGNRTVTTAEDTDFTFTTADFPFSDVDGDSLSRVRIDTLPTDGTVLLSGVAVTAGQIITAANITAGNLRFRPDTNENGSPYTTFTFSVGDASTFVVSPSTMTVNVTPMNDAPIARDNDYMTVEEQSVSGNVLTDDTGSGIDSDIDGDLLSVTVTPIVDVSNGTLLLAADGSFTYTPGAGFNGVDSFIYEIRDPSGLTSTAEVTLTVAPANDPPTGSDHSVTTPEDTDFVFATIDFPFNDPEGNPLAEVRIDLLPIEGLLLLDGVPVGSGDVITAADIAAGKLIFAPSLNENGSPYTTFDFTVGDGMSFAAASNTMTVHVTPQNDPPVADDETFSVPEDGSVIIDVLDGDTDLDGDTLFVSEIDGTLISLGNPVTIATGLVSLNADGTLTFVPNADFNGPVAFDYTVSDGLATDIGNVSGTVTPQNDPPVADDETFVVAEDGSVIIDVLDGDTDLDGDTLFVTEIDGTPISLGNPVTIATGLVSLNVDGTLTFTPNADFNGPVAFDYTVSDGLATDIGKVSGTVSPQNDPPIADDDAFVVPEDGSVIIDVLDGDTDLDGDTLSVTEINGTPISLGNPVTIATGLVSLNADGTLTFTPNADFNGPASFNYTVSDGSGETDIGDVSGTITPVNDGPTGLDNSVTTPEETDFVFAVADFPFGDLDGDPLAEVRIESLPSDGLLLLNGNPVSVSDVIDVADIASGLLVFRPDANENGSPYTTFDFSVGDGLLFSAVPNTMTVNVTPTSVSVVKSLFDSSDPNTVGPEVTIGEELCFALLVTMSEGNSTDLILTDLLPDGLQYDSWTLITSAAGSNGLLAANFNGSVPAPSVSGGTFDGEDVSFTFGAIGVAADSNATNNSFVLLVHAFVSEVPSNHDPLLGTPTLTNVVTADVSNPQPPVSSNPFDVTVVEPDLSVTIDNGVAALTAGQTTTYTITIRNDGDLSATGVTLSGSLPIDRVTFVATDDAANFSIDGSGHFTWAPAVAGLAPSGTLTLLLTVQVGSSLASGITDVTIPVSVTHADIEPTPANNSAADTDSLDAAPDLRLTKTDFTSSITPGAGSVYTINISNTGTQAATNVLVTETVPIGTTYNAALSDPLWTLIAPDTYQISLPTLAAGAGFNVNFSVMVDSPAMPGQNDIVNTVTISDDGTNGPDPNPGDNSATDTNTLVSAPDYQITISDGELVVIPGQPLSYSISFTNSGDQDGTGVVVTDTFPIAILENVVASDGGVVDAVAGTITWNVGNLAIGDSRSFTVTAKVRDTIPAGVEDFTHDTSITDDLSNGADPTPGNNTGTDTDTLDATLDYRIAITDGENAVAPGQSLSYTVSFLNSGNQEGTGVVVSDTFPIAILENVVASDGGIVDAVAGTITWNVGNLVAGESRSFTVTAKVRDSIPAGFDDFTHSTTITDDATNGTDPTPADSSSSDNDTLDAQPDYQISIDDGLLIATTGQLLTYSVTFANAGLQDGTGVIVSNSFPLPVLTNVVASNGGVVDMTTGSITWSVGNLAAGVSLTYTVTADVLSSVAAGIDDFAHSTSITDDGTNGTDPTAADNSASDTDTLDAAPDLQITKTDFANSISPGGGSVYTLNVGNLGTQGATNVVVSETVPTGTTFNAALSDPAWTNVGGNVYQYSILSLPAGASFNVNFSVLIDNPAVAGQSDIINTATIADDGTNGPDLDPSNDSATDTNTLDALPMYEIGIDDLQLTAMPGETLTYFVNFNNDGLQNGTGVILSASFPIAILTNVVASDGGVVDAVAGTITWNVGALAAHDPRTFTVTADVVSMVLSGATDFTLLASITDDGANGPDPDLSDNSASDTDTLDAEPDYAITIDDGETIVQPGDPLTYTINIANNGNQDGNGVVVSVSFPVTMLQNVVASNGGVVDAVAGTITWNLGDLAAGDSTTLTVSTQVRSNIGTQASSITLTATVTDDGLNGSDPTPLNNSDSDLDRLQVYAYDSFHDWKDMRFGFLAPQMQTVGRPLAPLPVDPVFSGLTEPGSTLTARIFAADGRLLGDRQVVADSGGNWLVSFPNLIIYEYPHRMEIIVTPAINNLSHENGFNLRRYFHPAIHAGLVMTEPLSVAGVFRNRAYNIVEAQHSANIHPLGFQWYSHAYELNAASSNVSQM